MSARMRFQFQLRTLFVFMLSAAVGLAWYSWFRNAYYDADYQTDLKLFDLRPDWQGFFAGLGFVGSIFVFRREPLLAQQMFVMSWLLVSIDIVFTCDDELFGFASSSSHGLWLHESEAILITRSIIMRSFTVPVVLFPFFLQRTELILNVLRRPLNRLFFLTTLSNSVLLIAMIRYQFLSLHLM